MDGNNSLKRIQHRKPAPIDSGDGVATVVGSPNNHKDERTVGEGYYITREQVDLWNRDIVLEWIKQHQNEIVSPLPLVFLFVLII